MSKGFMVPTKERVATIQSMFTTHPIGKRYRIKHDGFVGTVCGYYVRNDGYPGVCLQLENARVVHVYGHKWLEEE